VSQEERTETLAQGPEAIRRHYRDRDVAQGYLERRFEVPLGELLHARQLRVLRELVERRRLRKILEIAAGPARLTADLARLTGRPGVLLDASAPMLALARERLEAVGGPRWSYVLGDAFQLPFRGGFDLVYTFRFLRYFRAPERARLYREIARVLAPGGLLVFDAVNEVVSAPLRRRSPEKYPIYDALLRPEWIRNELAVAGFECESLQGVQHRFVRLTRLQNLLAPRSRSLCRAGIELVDRIGGGEPLEWIVTCRRV
jgi:ubiquinone/menaquinone biosynthesis C-methylase UbiE